MSCWGQAGRSPFWTERGTCAFVGSSGADYGCIGPSSGKERPPQDDNSWWEDLPLALCNAALLSPPCRVARLPGHPPAVWMAAVLHFLIQTENRKQAGLPIRTCFFPKNMWAIWPAKSLRN